MEVVAHEGVGIQTDRGVKLLGPPEDAGNEVVELGSGGQQQSALKGAGDDVIDNLGVVKTGVMVTDERGGRGVVGPPFGLDR